MKNSASRASIVRAIVWKDLRQFSRDRLWVTLTPFSLIFVIMAFWVLPDAVDEKITVGVFPPALAEALESLAEGGNTETQGFEVVAFDDSGRLAAAVSGEREDEEGKDISLGIAFPDDFATGILAGESIKVSVHVNAAVPEEIANALSSEIREIAYGLQAAANGHDPLKALPVALPDERMIILGEDRAGDQVPLREKMLPFMAILILMIEALALAGLVAVEIEQRTVTALLVTPARIGDVLAAKGITGAVLAVSQALIFLFATRGFGDNFLLVMTLMLLGAVMTSAVGMISGAAGKDFMSTLFYGIALITPLLIPAFAVLLPGSASLWVRMLPSHGLIEALVGVVGYSRGWSDVAPYMGTTLAWGVLLFGTALLILKRKMQAL